MTHNISAKVVVFYPVSVCLSVCYQLLIKTAYQIFMKI